MRVAFGPFMRSGKDTACFFLQKKHGGKILSFSQLLYKAHNKVLETFDMPIEKDRKLLLLLGEYATSKNSLLFVDQVEEQISLNRKGNIFVTDVRKKEEAEMLRRNGFVLVKIQRDVPREFSELEEKASSLDIWDVVVENNGTLQEFEKKLEMLFEACGTLPA
ncbi:conserved putative deoxynucleotide monophosphate kinase [Tokyovirus A1]|uniref:conserved putative deoxynucleotide monophosphate kinase n=1 Tax=Tokyovirus A1 TaxID=1826170 RepID=UPI0007A98B84|nr:conserved putative deoxynucleotide monophosphate kinase [Tokyovirus A1]BAU80128.1 conserved putative deoxynucleotide monophosphate kinase [Tokyovirus A1]